MARQGHGKTLMKPVIPIRQPTERNLALSILKAMRDSSSSATKNGGLLGMTAETDSSAACKAPPFRLTIQNGRGW